MPKFSRQAGQNVRDLAFKRRVSAMASFAGAAILTGLPVFQFQIVVDYLQKIFSPFDVSLALYGLFVFGFFVMLIWGLFSNGLFLWKRAKQADQGAKGEEETAREMVTLEQAGWQIEYGMELRNRLGDADIVCISPADKAYVIDVKSHRGQITTDGKQLFRRSGKKTYPFEKDFLAQAVKQSIQVKEQKKLSFVTPIVAFSAAKVMISAEPINQVYVVEKAKLVALLLSLG